MGQPGSSRLFLGVFPSCSTCWCSCRSRSNGLLEGGLLSGANRKNEIKDFALVHISRVSYLTSLKTQVAV